MTVIDTMMVLVEFVVLSGVFIASALMIASSRSEPLNAEPEAIASAVLVSAGLAVAFFDRRRCIALPLAVTAGTAGLMLALTAVAFTASAPIAVAVLALLALCGPLLADLRLRMTDFGRGTSSPWIPGMPTAASSVAITTALSAVAMLLTAALETTLRETIGLTLFAVAATCASLASALFAQRAIQSVDARVLAGALTSSLALGTLVTLRAQSVLDAPLDWLELRGVLASDVLALAFAIALAAAGWIATRRAKEALPSWLTDAPAIGWSGTYLVLNMVDRGPRPSLVFVALAIGVASAAFGGICRRIAPLTLGTALIVTTTLLGLGPTLAVVPVWLWIAFGGLSLIGLGLAIERKVGDEPWSPKTLVADVLDGFK